MRRMGGLAKKIPHTYRTMLIGAIAISGIPPLAGFFSKDEILGEAFKLGFAWVWAIGVVVAVMTAFYMFRLIGMTFWGESRVDAAVEPKIHESPRVMTAPALAARDPVRPAGPLPGLAGPAARAAVRPGGPGAPRRLAGAGLRARAARSWATTRPSSRSSGSTASSSSSASPWPPPGCSPRGASSASRSGRSAGAAGRSRSAPSPARVPFLYRASLNKWWFDELNHLVFIVIGGRVAAFLWWFDAKVVDGIVNGIGSVTRRSGGGLARVQTGRVQNYALGIAIGLIVMVGSYLMIARP